VNLVIKSQLENSFGGNCAVEEEPFASDVTCGISLETLQDIDPTDANSGDIGTVEPAVEFGKPLQDWFEMALRVESPVRGGIRASWGEDEDEVEEEPLKEETDDEDSDPFEDFDDDFEEELDDEYEIEPADDGLVTDADADLGNGEILDEDEEIGPDIDEIE
jgi:hypothetical protein